MPTEVTIDDIEKQPIGPNEVTARCRSYEWKGKPLRPFSSTRKDIAVRLGCVIFQPDPSIRQTKNGIWPEFTSDAMICVWTMTIPDEALPRFWLNTEKSAAEYVAWRDSEAVSLGGKGAETEAHLIFNMVIEDIQTVQAIADSTGTSSGSDNLGE